MHSSLSSSYFLPQPLWTHFFDIATVIRVQKIGLFDLGAVLFCVLLFGVPNILEVTEGGAGPSNAQHNTKQTAAPAMPCIR